MIETHGRQKGLDGRGGLPQLYEAAAALLVEPAETRMMPLERRERRERLGDSSELTLRYGHEEESLALRRLAGEQRLARGENLREAALPQQRAQHRHLGGYRWARIHARSKKGRTSQSAPSSVPHPAGPDRQPAVASANQK